MYKTEQYQQLSEQSLLAMIRHM